MKFYTLGKGLLSGGEFDRVLKLPSCELNRLEAEIPFDTSLFDG
jgi:hypothetical protein